MPGAVVRRDATTSILSVQLDLLVNMKFPGSDKRESDEDLNKEWSDTVDDLWNVTNKTVGKMSSALTSYSDRIFDHITDLDIPMLGDVMSSSWPVVRARRNHEEAADVNNDRAPAQCANLWAYPVPSFRQYNKCVDNNGVSAWSRDGVWRCLFPSSEAELDFDGKNVSDPADRRWFKDYSVFLDWRRAMYLAQVAKAKSEEEQRAQLRDQSRSLLNDQWKSPFPDSTTKDLKYVSEEEARNQGKRVISSSMFSETVTQDDGTVAHKTCVKKWYDDNTVSVTETTDSKPLDHKGWFWK